MIALVDSGLAQLVKREGAAFEKLLGENRGLVLAAARRAVGKRPWHQFQEVAIQGATVGLWLASQSYSQEGEPWGRLAYRMARAEALRYVRAETGGIPGCEPIESVDSLQAPSQSLGLIDERFQALAEVLASGSSQRQAGALLGLSHRGIRTAVSYLKKEIVS